MGYGVICHPDTSFGFGPGGSFWEADTFENIEHDDITPWIRVVLMTMEGWTLCQYGTELEVVVDTIFERYLEGDVSKAEKDGQY